MLFFLKDVCFSGLRIYYLFLMGVLCRTTKPIQIVNYLSLSNVRDILLDKNYRSFLNCYKKVKCRLFFSSNPTAGLS